MSSDKTPGHLFCFGYGYSAGALARLVKADGWTVSGTVREPDRRARMAMDGVIAWPFPLPQPAAALAPATHILISIPPGADGDPVLRHHRDDLRHCPQLAWLGYLSTTGIYGDHGGAWVDETTAPRPTGLRQRHRLDAENAWLALHQTAGLPVHRFRLPGIYGPGRSAIDSVRAGTAHRIDKPGQVFSRIHVEDLARVLLASIARPRPGAVYNVADDLPCPGHEVVSFACELMGVAPPPLVRFEAAGLSPMARSFYADSKRVSNRLIKSELAVSLLYPTYRNGLQAHWRSLRNE